MHENPHWTELATGYDLELTLSWCPPLLEIWFPMRPAVQSYYLSKARRFLVPWVVDCVEARVGMARVKIKEMVAGTWIVLLEMPYEDEQSYWVRSVC